MLSITVCCLVGAAAVPSQILPEHLSPKNMTRDGVASHPNALLPEHASNESTFPATDGAQSIQPAVDVPEPTGSHEAQAAQAAAVAAVDPVVQANRAKAAAEAKEVADSPGTERLERANATGNQTDLQIGKIEYFEGCTFLGVYTLPAIDSPTQRLSTEVFIGVLLVLALVLSLTGKCIFGGWLGTAASATITLAGIATGVIFGLFCWWVFYSSESNPATELKVSFITGDTWWFWILFTLVAAIVAGALAYLATKMTALLVGAAIGFPVGAVIVMSYQSAVGALPAFAIPCILIASCIVFALVSQCFFGEDEKGERLIAIATAFVGATLAAGLGRMIICINGISMPAYTDIAVLGAVAGVGVLVQLCLCSGVTFNKKKDKK